MKKTIFSALCGLALFTISCSNDDIVIETGSDVTVNVSLSSFFSSYNFNDTYHGISVTEDFRTFHSEHDKFIHVRTLFYNSNGNLVDSLITFSSTTNSVSQNGRLPEGTYTVITTLNFSDEENYESSWWELCAKEKLSTVYLEPYSRFSIWGIMAYTAQTVTISSGTPAVVSVTPRPIGALAYMFLQNFQYKNEATYGTIADNGVRSLAFYSQNIADGYKLDPNATEKYVYKEATGSDNWYYLSNKLTPSSFSASKDYGYFRTNLYAYFYILAPSFNGCFGYMLDGENAFTAYGMSNYTITNGNTYLAYWDWFQVGNPYFGVADNNHWHRYSNDARGYTASKPQDKVEGHHDLLKK